jgi:hypothetical protein
MPDKRGPFDISPEVWGLAVLTASEAPNFFSGLMPSKMTIARFAADEGDVVRLRQAEVIATLMTGGAAVGASLVAKSWLPMILTAGVTGVLLWQYEDAIRNPHPNVMPINSAQNVNS